MGSALLVLAAGMGSRFGGVKQVEPVGPCGEAILEYSIYDAMRAGFDEMVFLVRKDIEADFRERILSRIPPSIPCRLAFQETDSLVGALDPPRLKPWGTGHALLCAAAGMDKPFAVMNADDYYGCASLCLVRGFLDASDPAGARWCMAGYRLRQTTSPHGSVSRGLCEMDVAGRLVSVREHVRIETGKEEAEGGPFLSLQPDGTSIALRGDEIVSMNLWGLTPRVYDLGRPLLDAFIEGARSSAVGIAVGSATGTAAGIAGAEFQLPAVVDALVGRGLASVEVLETADSWFGLTYREDLGIVKARIAALVEAGSYPAPLWG